VAGYTKNVGEGAICVLTPGHTLSVWEDKNFQKLFVNAIKYCAAHGKA
jgi:trehalose utilization protein